MVGVSPINVPAHLAFAEPDHGDAPTTLYIVGSEASSNLESKETEVCHGML